MLIKNARIYGEDLKDIRIENGVITEIASNLESDEVFDAKSLLALPSFVDLNVNFKNDSFSIENLKLLENECLRGGFCSVLLRDKMNYDEHSFELFADKLKTLTCRIFASISILNDDKKIKNISSLADNGAKALELLSSSKANHIKQAMLYSIMKDIPVFTACYDDDFDDGGVMNDGQLSFSLGLCGISEICELSEVAKMKEIAKFYKTKVIFENLSLAKSLEILDKDNLKLVSIHNLTKDESACENFNTYAKLMPPLRKKSDVLSLRQALKEGRITFLSSFHSPKSLHLKDLAFDEAAFGVHSLNEYLSICNTFFIKEKLLSWRELCTYTSLNPAKILGLNCGEIAVNKEANLILVDENESIQNIQNPLYANDKLFACIKHHFIQGNLVL